MSSPHPDRRTRRREIILVAGILLVGLGLRIALPSRMAVEHFDEGVYASNLWFDADNDYQYPSRHLYAPPLLPGLIEWSIVLFGAQLGPMVPNLLAGSLTVPAVWWVARRWFGPEAGAAAVVLAALSDFHILYSRTALTDALLGLWFLLAVYAIWEAFRTLALRWMLAAGTATALAWWTKYNGWLPLAVGLAGLVPWLVLQRRTARVSRETREPALPAAKADGVARPESSKGVGDGHNDPSHTNVSRETRGVARPDITRGPADPKQSAPHANVSRETRTLPPHALPPPPALPLLVRWLGIALTGIALWSPVWYSLQSRGGYAAVAENHRRYFVGVSGWWDGLLQQVANHGWLSGWLSAASLGAALLAAFALRPSGLERFTWNARLMLIATALMVVFLAALLGPSVVLGIAAILGIPGLLWNQRNRSDPASRERELAVWLLAAWFIGLLVVTPLYRPYPRLTLPWLPAAWLLSGTFVATYIKGLLIQAEQARRRTHSFAVATVLVLSTAGLLLFAPGWGARGIVGWQPRLDVMAVAQQIAGETARITQAEGHAPDEVVIYVYAEPGLFYHLRASGLELVGPVQNLDFAQPGAKRIPLPTFLVTGPHAERSEAFPLQWEQWQERFEPVETYHCSPSDLVLLDHYTPAQLAAAGARPVERIRLYRAKE